MTGKTNIPPRVGGIVNGDIKDCIVQDATPISIGDYVEIVEGKGNFFTEEGLSIEDVCCIGQFKSLDHAIFFYKKNVNTLSTTPYTLHAKVIGVKNSGLTEITDLTFDLSQIVVNPMDFYIVNISNRAGVFFVICKNTANNFYTFIIEIHSDLSTSVYKRTMTGDINFDEAIYQNYKLSNERFFVYDSNGSSYTKAIFISTSYLYLINLSSNTITKKSLSKSFYNIKLIENIGSYFIIIDSSTITTLDSNFKVADEKQMNVENPALIDNVIICYSGNTVNTIAYLVNEEYVDLSIIKINDLGEIIIKKFDNSYKLKKNDEDTGYEKYCFIPSFIFGYVEGKIVAYSFYATSGKKIKRMYVSIGKYDDQNDELSFGSMFEVSNVNVVVSSSSSNSNQKIISFNPTYVNDIKNTLIAIIPIGGSAANSYYKVSYSAVKIEQETLVDFNDVIPVKKYKNRINGIAKTAGANGAEIQVYVPKQGG